jgi:hypothetical protein
MQVLEQEDSGPRLKVEGLIWNTFPENVMETGVSKSQGTFQQSISRSITVTRQLVNILVQVPEPILREPGIRS